MSQVIEVVERYILPDLPDSSQLPEEDGVPLETNWHRSQMNLLIDVVRRRWRDRQDFFAGGNMFVYYSMNQVRKQTEAERQRANKAEAELEQLRAELARLRGEEN